MYQLCFYVPKDHAESVKDALFAKGAGKIGHYDRCCWQTLGQGQFRPLKGSQPFLGKHDTVEKVSEYKIEMVCDDTLIQSVIAELKKAPPYEEPAYLVWRLQT